MTYLWTFSKSNMEIHFNSLSVLHVHQLRILYSFDFLIFIFVFQEFFPFSFPLFSSLCFVLPPFFFLVPSSFSLFSFFSLSFPFSSFSPFLLLFPFLLSLFFLFSPSSFSLFCLTPIFPGLHLKCPQNGSQSGRIGHLVYT